MSGRDAPRHVIFDLDGTLVDSCAVCVDILSDILVERGSQHVIDRVYARSLMSRGGLEMVAGLLGSACVDSDADLAEFRARYRKRQTSIETLFPGVSDGLKDIRDAGFILSVCSNKPQDLCEKVLEDTGLANHFSLVVGGRPELRPKPASDLLDTVLAGLGAAAAECLFVGDSELDYQIAQDAGIPFLFMSYGYAAKDWAPEVSTTFHCFQNLTDMIVSHRAHA
ncbi:MAG: family hydrolase [Sphingomonadales bacterium]|nr:family hydrolase [Sphingomonadales bacterium]